MILSKTGTSGEKTTLSNELTWLHVSDFHFGAGEDSFSEDISCQALLEDLKTRVGEHESFAFVLVTGDIAFSGQPEQYEAGATFLRQLANDVSVDVSRFFFVPGNHDVDRTIHDFAQVGAMQVLT